MLRDRLINFSCTGLEKQCLNRCVKLGGLDSSSGKSFRFTHEVYLGHHVVSRREHNSEIILNHWFSNGGTEPKTPTAHYSALKKKRFLILKGFPSQKNRA